MTKQYTIFILINAPSLLKPPPFFDEKKYDQQP